MKNLIHHLRTPAILSRFFQGKIYLACHFFACISCLHTGYIYLDPFLHWALAMAISAVVTLFVFWVKEKFIDPVYTPADMVYNVRGVLAGCVLIVVSKMYELSGFF